MGHLSLQKGLQNEFDVRNIWLMLQQLPHSRQAPVQGGAGAAWFPQRVKIQMEGWQLVLSDCAIALLSRSVRLRFSGSAAHSTMAVASRLLLDVAEFLL